MTSEEGIRKACLSLAKKLLKAAPAATPMRAQMDLVAKLVSRSEGVESHPRAAYCFMVKNGIEEGAAWEHSGMDSSARDGG